MGTHRVRVAAVVLLGLVGTARAEVRYSLTVLGPADPNMGHPYGINDQGQVAGTLFGPAGESAFLYTNGHFADLSALGSGQTEARGINSLGQLVGFAGIGTTSSHLFLYDNGAVTNLSNQTASDSNGPLLTVSGINDHGQIAGAGHAFIPNTHALLLSNGALTDLGTLGGNYSQALGVNNSGDVVGFASLDQVDTAGSGHIHAFLYHGAMHDLGTLGGDWSHAVALNNHGDVVGIYHIPSPGQGVGSEHAFVYRNGVMTSLGALGGTESSPDAINDLGQIVGGTGTGAFLYDNGVMTDLNTSIDPSAGVSLVEAEAINNLGAIVATGYRGRQFQAYLLTPVPEPSCIVCGVLGLVTAGFLRRQRANPPSCRTI